MKYSLAALLISQFGLSVSFYANEYMISCLLTSMLFVATLLLVFRIAAPIFEEEDETEKLSARDSGIRESTNPMVQKWERAYNHPLQISNEEIMLQRNERRISVNIRQ